LFVESDHQRSVWHRGFSWMVSQTQIFWQVTAGRVDVKSSCN
jgi:hypothetical protein